MPNNDTTSRVRIGWGSARSLLKDDEFTTNLLGQCDLKFCAIILRLADVLDFDNSRSPDEVYRYLGLSRRATRREVVSDVEWLKHLNSNGFVFPDGPKRMRGYSLTFIAS